MENNGVFMDLNAMTEDARRKIIKNVLLQMTKTAYQTYTGEKNASVYFVIKDNDAQQIQQQNIGNPVEIIDILTDSLIRIIIETHPSRLAALHLYEITRIIGEKALEQADKCGIQGKDLPDEYERFINDDKNS